MFRGRFFQGALGALVLFAIPFAQAGVRTYCCDAAAEAAYLADVAALGFPVSKLHEGFDLAPWGAETAFLRGTPQPSVTNQGFIWSPPTIDGFVATSTGAGNIHDGSYLMYSLDSGAISHPVPDGYTVTANDFVLYGVGGWFRGSNTKLAFTVDGDPLRVDFTGAEATVSEWKFLGFIETDEALGFSSLEIRSADEVGNETKIFFSDDFTFAHGTDIPPSLPAGSLQFSASAFTVAESAASVLLTVTRTGGSSGAVSVDYATADSTATAGSDYTAAAGTLSFADGETSQTFNVAIVDDSLFEGDETFNLSLSNVSGGASLGPLATASVTITEDELPPPAGSLQFSAADFSVAESGGGVAITVTRTGGSAAAVSVDYASAGGSATAGSDYSAATGTLDFAVGVISQSFTVDLLDDSLFEGNETFNLSLSNVSGGASVGTPATASVTITDDDPPPLLDSNGDGLSDADAVALGLDPNDPEGDTDNDGISDVLEVGSDVNNATDGDVDGVIDALEPGADAADAMIASGLPLDGGGTVVITTATGETLSGVSAATATGGPAGINFPFGTVSYTTSAAVGGSVAVQMEFSADLPANLTLYKVDRAGVYRELAASLWTRVSPRRVDLTLTDGDPLIDLDGVANASIEDPVAPAEVVPLADSSSGGGGGGGGCVLNAAMRQDPAFSLFMLAALAYRFRRRPL